LTTRSEAYTSPPGEAVKRQQKPVWDIVLAICTVTYILFVLFDGIDSPLLGLALIACVAHRLVQAHLGRSRPHPAPHRESGTRTG
jgi:hypothetical protein